MSSPLEEFVPDYWGAAWPPPPIKATEGFDQRSIGSDSGCRSPTNQACVVPNTGRGRSATEGFRHLIGLHRAAEIGRHLGVGRDSDVVRNDDRGCPQGCPCKKARPPLYPSASGGVNAPPGLSGDGRGACRGVWCVAGFAIRACEPTCLVAPVTSGRRSTPPIAVGGRLAVMNRRVANMRVRRGERVAVGDASYSSRPVVFSTEVA